MCVTFQTALRYLGAAIVFGICGALSAAVLLPVPGGFPFRQTFGNYLLGLPFSLLCTLWFMRTPRAVLIIISMSLTWIVSYRVATIVGMIYDPPYPFLAAWVGGLIGGLGLTLSAAIGWKRLLTPRHLIVGCAVGWLSALPLGIWLGANESINSATPSTLYCAFGIWQAATGMYLYGICINASTKTRHEVAVR
jgi:hypothetical protein